MGERWDCTAFYFCPSPTWSFLVVYVESYLNDWYDRTSPVLGGRTWYCVTCGSAHTCSRFFFSKYNGCRICHIFCFPPLNHSATSLCVPNGIHFGDLSGQFDVTYLAFRAIDLSTCFFRIKDLCCYICLYRSSHQNLNYQCSVHYVFLMREKR